MSDIDIYSSGIVFCSICVPEDLTQLAIEEGVNNQLPLHGDLRWKVSKAPCFRGGELNPCKCPHTSGRLHYLMEC